MKKLANILQNIFAVGILLCLLAGGVSAILYIVALFIGGERATLLCSWTFKAYLPWVIKFTSIFAAIGLISMYISKEKALTISNEDTTKVNK